MKGNKLLLALLFMTTSSFDAFSIKKRHFSLYQPNPFLGKWPSIYHVCTFLKELLLHQHAKSPFTFLSKIWNCNYKKGWEKMANPLWYLNSKFSRVVVQGVKSLGSHFACLCRGFNFYEVKKNYYFSKRKGKYLYTFNHFYSEKSSKRAK